MQKVEEFMRDLLSERIAEEMKILTNRAGYRQQFFSADCLWDSRAYTLEMLESEKIVSIEDPGDSAVVITEYKATLPKLGVVSFRRRFHLALEGDHWLIRLVESECLACHGQGDESCVGCKGKHWK